MISIVSINKTHPKRAFDCNEPDLNFFFKHYAFKNERISGKTYVAVEDAESIAGYVTLAAGELATKEIPEAFREKLPKYPVPVVLIAKLAVDVRFQKKRIGALLLRHAAEQALAVADRVGCYGLHVDALNENAKAFYLHYGFLQSPDRPLQLFLPLKTIEAAARELE
jgi:GNAT superfamily N-acetyltransferase